MKLSIATALAIASYVSTSPLPDESAGLVKRAANAFAVGSKFNIDGSTNYFVGSNSYWISYLSNPADIDLTMSHVAASGLKVLRVWGFNDVRQQTSGDWMQSFIPGQQPQINLGPNGLGKLDNVVAAAEKYNVKLIIPFVNFWNDYGGIQVYADYYGIKKTDFYTNAAAQAQYKKYIATLVNKYKASTSIFAWELGNEPRCPGCATSVIYNWASDVSAYIKSLDPAHMVTLGDEGWMNGGGDGSYAYSLAEGVDFAKNLEIKTLDFGTFHLYPESWNLLPAQSAGVEWFKNHAAACLKAGKPCVAEEYGFTGSERQTIIKAWQDTGLSLRDSGLAGAMFWQWGEQLSYGLTHDDGHAIYYNSPLWTTLVRDHVASANAGGSSPSTTRSVPAVTTTTARVSSTTTTARVSATTSRAVVTTSAPVTRTTTTTAQPTTTSPSSGGGTAQKWGQCGGQGWTGPTVCAAGSTCTFSNPWYSQCL